MCNSSVMYKRCPGCGRHIYDQRADYCSVRCRKSSEFGVLTEQQKKELDILMKQYREGGFE